jgi:outer membrane protein
LLSAAAIDPYFSVDAAQSLASGLPVYDAGGGIRSYGAGAQLRYEVTPQWGTYVYVEYERLTGDVADSPLVALRGSANQTTVGAGITYSFDVALPF